ncbi:MAG: hypothetical protein WCN92_05010 [Eubacteriales bacterium]
MVIVIKKLALAVIISCVIMSLLLFAGCNILPKTNTTENTAALQSDTSQTAQGKAEVSTQTPSSEPPAISTYYELNKTVQLDAEFTVGFIVKLPKIISDKPGAMEINAEIDEIKTRVEQAYSLITNLNEFTEQHTYSYEYYVKNNVIFISINGSIGYWQSEFVVGNLYFAYDYVLDKSISNSEIADMFSLGESQIVDMVNLELAAKGAAEISSFDKITLFVNAAGKLVADVSVEDLVMSGESSELVVLA